MRPLVWFRSDLRIHDNTALHAASKKATHGIVAVFCVTDKQWADSHEWGIPKADFVLRAAHSLQTTLAKLNISLRVILTPTYKQLPKALVDLARQSKCDALYFNDEHELNERRRDEAVQAAFNKAAIAVHRFNDATVFPPGSLLTQQGTLYTVFTPFKNTWRARWNELAAQGDHPAVHNAPKKQQEAIGTAETIPSIADLPAFKSPRDGDPKGTLWPATEQEATKRLTKFCAQRINSYKDKRDIPSVDGTSSLSPYLACGLISPRQCVHAAHATNFGPLQTGVACWVDELIWREFYHHLTAQRDIISMGKNFRREYDAVQWNSNEAHLEAWKHGQTGYPIVDAAMRQLEQTGWMHNRLRMVAAMFLTKHLLIHWRAGEEHFCRRLVDLDYASNNGGWQWSASTGTDAQPYFRVFNPTSQSEKFDSEGSFIRTFVPELADLDPDEIHDPTSLARVRLGYPQALVEHKSARERAISTFKAARG
jgi:deoxyribodipyrimidine photo-lyase